jgi:hypothetical protein
MLLILRKFRTITLIKFYKCPYLGVASNKQQGMRRQRKSTNMGKIRKAGRLFVLDDLSDEQLRDGILKEAATIVESGEISRRDEPSIYDYNYEITKRLRKPDCTTLQPLKPYLIRGSNPISDDEMKVAALLYPFYLQQERAKLREMDRALAEKEEAAILLAQSIREEVAAASDQTPPEVEKKTSKEQQLQQIQIVDAIAQKTMD